MTDTPRRSTRRNGSAPDVEMVDPAVLVPYSGNSRVHEASHVAQIAASIEEFGFTVPVLADEENVLVAGHGRVLAALELGLPEVPVIRLKGLTEAQKRAYVIADNRLTEIGGWNEEMLAREMHELSESGFDVTVMGFSKAEADRITAALVGTTGLTDPDDAPPPQPPPIVQRGEVWLLGEHRLMCGDCRDPDDMAALMASHLINVAFTSPPYAEQREYDAESGFEPIPPDRYVDWFEAVSENVKTYLLEDGSWFVNIKPSADGLDTHLYVMDLVIAHVRRWGWHFATEFCWERNGIPKQVIRRFKNQFEPVYQFARGDWKMRPDAVRHSSRSVPKARGKGAGNTSWGEHQGGGIKSIHMSGNQGRPDFEWFGDKVATGMAYPGNRLPTFTSSHEALGHSAAFPVGLPEFFIRAFTDAGDVVFDPFMGSGSTLIAAHKTRRIGLGMELSPLYCDVIIRRWQAFAGQPAVREGDDAEFDVLLDEQKRTWRPDGAAATA